MAPKTWSTKGTVVDAELVPANDNAPKHDPEAPVPVGLGGPTNAGWHSCEAGIWCKKEGQYKYVRGVHVPQLQVPDHFAVGAMLHGGRAAWFGLKFAADNKSIAAVKDAAYKVAEELESQNRGHVSAKAKADVLKYLDEYISHWVTRPKPQPVAAEYPVGPAPLQAGDQFPLWRTARLDDVSYYPEALGGLCIGEAKTTSGSVQDAINQYTLHGQPILQYILFKNAENGERAHGPLKGIVLDIIKKGYGKERSQFARHFVEVTERTQAWYVQNMRAYLRQFAAMEWDSDVERNIMACTRMVGRARMACEYRDLCMHGKTAAGNYVLRDGQPMSSWKPSPGQTVPPWE